MSPGSQPKKVAIIGAGPAGLAAAKVLSRHGVACEIFEASSRVGGMAGSFELWGQRVDVGPHRFFSADPRVNGLWLEATGDRYTMVSRKTRILYGRTFFAYPLEIGDAFSGLGIRESLLCGLSLLRALFFPTAPEASFEDWVSNRFGKRLYTIFFEAYTQKLWGINPAKLDADFARQRIKKFSFVEALLSSLFRSRRKKHRTLVDEFAYPDLGAGQPYENLAAALIEQDVPLRLQAAITKLDFSANAISVETSSEKFEGYSNVISTMPLTQLVATLWDQQMGEFPQNLRLACESLRFRNTILVYLEVREEELFEDQWVYVNSSDVQTGRITNFNNWGDGVPVSGSSILAMEFWCQDEDDIWTSPDAAIIEQASNELRTTGLIGGAAIGRGKVIRVPKCYPIYDSGYENHLETIKTFLEGFPSVTPIGRYGSFKYNNQDHSILMGILVAENIALGAKHDLWEVNTDYEYQESSRITDTGLIQEQ